MIMIWNQMEVFMGYPTMEMKIVLDTLKVNGIKFKCRVFNGHTVHLFNSRVLSVDFFGINQKSSNIYYIYVHKKDIERIKALLHAGQLENLPGSKDFVFPIKNV